MRAGTGRVTSSRWAGRRRLARGGAAALVASTALVLLVLHHSYTARESRAAHTRPGHGASSGVGADTESRVPGHVPTPAVALRQGAGRVDTGSGGADAPDTASTPAESGASQPRGGDSPGVQAALEAHDAVESSDESTTAWDPASHPTEPTTGVLPRSRLKCRRVMLHTLPHGGFGSAFMRTIAGIVLASATGREFVEHHATRTPYDRGCPGGRRGLACFLRNFSNCRDVPTPPAAQQLTLVDSGGRDPAVARMPAEAVVRGVWAFDYDGYAAALDGLCTRMRCDEARRKCRVTVKKQGRDPGLVCQAKWACSPDALGKPPYWGYKPVPRVGQLRTVAQAIWRLRPEVQDAVASRLQVLQLRHPYMAVHVRRGDKKREAREVSPAAYVDAVLSLAQRSLRLRGDGLRGLQVLLMGDDFTSVKALSRLLRRHGFVTLTAATPEYDGFNERTFRSGESPVPARRLALDLLADVQAAVAADAFVGTESSNVGSMVQLLRTQNPDTAVDAASGRPMRVRECARRGERGCFV